MARSHCAAGAGGATGDLHGRGRHDRRGDVGDPYGKSGGWREFDTAPERALGTAWSRGDRLALPSLSSRRGLAVFSDPGWGLEVDPVLRGWAS